MGLKLKLVGGLYQHDYIEEIDEQLMLYDVVKAIASDPDNLEKIAIMDGHREITYGQLMEAASSLATIIQREAPHNPDRQLRVGLLLKKSAEFFMTILALWKIGAVPVFLGDESQEIEKEGKLPKRTMEKIETAEVSIVFSDKEIKLENIKCLRVPGDIFTGSDFNPSTWERDEKYGLQNDAYVTFTSGSTGKPKGPLTRHEGLYSRLVAIQKHIGVTPDDVIAQSFDLDADAFIFDILMSLGTGAKLVLLSKASGAELKKWFYERKVTIAVMVPTQLRAVKEAEDTMQGHADPYPLTHLRVLISTGEAIEDGIFSCFYDGTRKLINGYGPSEDTIASSLEEYKPGEEVSIGKPIQGVGFHIFEVEAVQGEKIQWKRIREIDKSENPEETEKTKYELWISGLGLATHYLGDDENVKELNKERFVELDGKKYYRTGDKAFWRGEKVVLNGRLDRQFKINSKIIAPEEYERVITQSGLASSAEVRKATIHRRDCMVACIQVPEGVNKDEYARRCYKIAKHIASEMGQSGFVPTKWIARKKDELPPTTGMGKSKFFFDNDSDDNYARFFTASSTSPAVTDMLLSMAKPDDDRKKKDHPEAPLDLGGPPGPGKDQFGDAKKGYFGGKGGNK